jgi:leucyl aminopeptidase
VPSSENLLGAKAYKPGDVLKMYNGVTVEILNTDAEGRLILADAICMAVEDGVKKIVNTATLTGAVLGALGHVRTGLFCKNDELTDLVKAASDECDEKVWQLPLDDEYKVILGSTCADISNSGTRMAGATTAAIFLHEFCGDVPFCHLDIAGTAWVENLPTQYSFKPYLPKDGASGTVARTIGLIAEKLEN